MPGSKAGLEQALLSSRRTGKPVRLPPDDFALADAYALQRTLHQHSGLPVMVWKLGLTAEGPRSALGASEPIVGRLPASAIYSDRSEISFAGTEMFAEAELVFELGDDLPPAGAPYSRESVSRMLKGVYAGIEVAGTRFVDSDLPLGLLVADNSMAHGLVLGRKLAGGWDARFADLPVSLHRNGEPPVHGTTARAMGNPLDALVWLANWLCEKDEGGLRREQLVASGTCTGVTEIFTGDSIVATFDGVQSVRVSLSA